MLIAPALIVEVDPTGFFQTRIVLAGGIVSLLITLLMLLAIDRAFALLILTADPGVPAIVLNSARLIVSIIVFHDIVSFCAFLMKHSKNACTVIAVPNDPPTTAT